MWTLRARLRHLGTWTRDDGVSLIEAVVALSIAAAVFLSMGAASLVAVRATLNGRVNQQAGDFLSQRLEEVRAMDYASLAMVGADVAGDAAVTTCGATKCYDGEELVLNDLGSVSPHSATVDATKANNQTITLSTYVTRPADAFGADYKRLTVVATWNAYGQEHSRRISTIVTATQRGLPLPVYKAEVVGSSAVSVNPGATVTYVIRVTNQGARDRFSIAASGSTVWSYYVDGNNNGAYNVFTDPAVTDSNGDGTLDTGFMEPTTSVTLLAVTTVPPAASAGSETTTFTFTSVAQPAASTAVKNVAVTTTVVIGAITASPTPTASVTATPTPTPTVSTSDCTASTVPTATAGSGDSVYRYYLQGGATDPLAMARATGYTPASATPATTTLASGGTKSWSYTVSNPRPTFSSGSTAVVSLWVSTAAGSASLTAQLVTRQSSGTLIKDLGTVTLVASPFTCGGYQQLAGSVTLPAGLAKMPNNGQLVLTVTNGGSADVTVAYDATLAGTPAGRYQSYVDIGSSS